MTAKCSMIPLCDPLIGQPEEHALIRCIRSGFVSSVGPQVPEFEKRFAKAVGANYAIATASGTAAIHAALCAMGIGPGSAVAVSDLTFVASMNPALYCGARPELVDIDPGNWCMDPVALEGLCKRRAGGRAPLKAVIPVHLYGGAADMKRICAIARKYGLAVVEDATEALGTTIYGRQAGLFGDFGCFSFNGNKMITTGAGGMLVTNSSDLAKHARYLVNQARDSLNAYIHGCAGFNYRMDGLSAALGTAQLQRYRHILAAKTRIAERYDRSFYGIEAISLQKYLPGVKSGRWMYSILVKNPALRDIWLTELNGAGIAARPFFHPLHRQPYVNGRIWTRSGKRDARAVQSGTSDFVSAAGINLPCSASLTTGQQERVIREIKRLAFA